MKAVVVNKRTGVVHLVDDTVTAYPATMCGRWARRNRFRQASLPVDEVSCERCWDVVASREPRRRRTREAVTA